MTERHPVGLAPVVCGGSTIGLTAPSTALAIAAGARRYAWLSGDGVELDPVDATFVAIQEILTERGLVEGTQESAIAVGDLGLQADVALARPLGLLVSRAALLVVDADGRMLVARRRDSTLDVPAGGMIGYREEPRTIMLRRAATCAGLDASSCGEEPRCIGSVEHVLEERGLTARSIERDRVLCWIMDAPSTTPMPGGDVESLGWADADQIVASIGSDDETWMPLGALAFLAAIGSRRSLLDGMTAGNRAKLHALTPKEG